MFNKKLLATAIAGSSAVLGQIPAFAENESSMVLEEVVVTATRRAESAQDVPIPVTAISGDRLERSFAQDARDLNGIAPNVQLQPVGAFQNAAAFYIRGVGSTDIESATDPGIATFIDDVYQGRVSTALQDFVDISAVEVLRGPQGTLFGRNAIGGVVHLQHNEPDFEAVDWGIGVTVGQEDRLDVKFVGNVPLSDTAAFRLAGKSTQADGFYDNKTPGGKDLNGQDRLTLLPSFKWAPNDQWDVLLRGEYNRTRDDSWANIPYSACRQDPTTTPGFAPGNDVVINFISAVFANPADAASFCGQEVDEDSFDVRHDQPEGSFSDFDIWGLTARVNHYMDGVGTLTYIANYRDVEEDVVNDFDTTDYDLFRTRRIQEHYQFSHELRFASEFSESVQLVTGLYYFEQEYEMDQFTNGLLVGGSPIFGNSTQLNQAWAAFGQVDWSVNEKLSLTLGLRYSAEEKEFDHCGVGFGDPVSRSCQIDLGGGFVSTLLQEDEDWSAVSPRLGANYFLNDNVMVYFSYAQGFRSGGFNGRGNTPSSIGPFDEETADNYEIGIKSDLFDQRLRLNASAFLMDYEDLQRAAIRPAPGGAGQETVTENVGSAENWGIELEMQAILTEQLSAFMTVGYLDASNEEWCAAVNGVLATDAPPAGFSQCGPSTEVFLPGGGSAGFLVPVDVSHLPPPQSPEWSVRFDLVYDMRLRNDSSLQIAGSWRYSSEVSLVSAGLPAGTLDGVVQYNGEFVNPERDSTNIFDLNVTWRSANENWRVSGYVKNLTDELYAGTGTFVAGLFNFTQMNHPRHWGVEFAYRM
ncbi:MAG: TonB-dependent receptor [Pseudomonadales bacterium]